MNIVRSGKCSLQSNFSGVILPSSSLRRLCWAVSVSTKRVVRRARRQLNRVEPANDGRVFYHFPRAIADRNRSAKYCERWCRLERSASVCEQASKQAGNQPIKGSFHVGVDIQHSTVSKRVHCTIPIPNHNPAITNPEFKKKYKFKVLRPIVIVYSL